MVPGGFDNTVSICRLMVAVRSCDRDGSILISNEPSGAPLPAGDVVVRLTKVAEDAIVLIRRHRRRIVALRQLDPVDRPLLFRGIEPKGEPPAILERDLIAWIWLLDHHQACYISRDVMSKGVLKVVRRP
jgi:hypothetical protein